MNRERWAKVREVFGQALDREGDDRRAFLEEACSNDATLRAEVDRLLGEHECSAGFLASTPEGPWTHAPDPGPIPRTIGPYEILHVIGEGGMGVVYLARQESPRRDVALKVIRPGLISNQILRRFQNEAQILGRLQHPGIAQVYSAGTHETSDGARPYFVMEHVVGEPLLEFVTRRSIPTRERLHLLSRIADAVQHAHQRGVIHRDLKPANILITTADIQPKILDFGVARVTEPDLRVTTLQTDVGQIIGTLAYMSPEQIAGDPADVDTRADVYALGVILYELLTGRLPFPVAGQSLAQAAHLIRETEPVRISSIDRALRGDIETIVAKALSRHKDDRYASAAELAADIRRYLAGEPITARPPSTLYQLRVFARRNRALVGGTLVSFVLLLLGISGTSWQAVVATRERTLAQLHAAEAQTQAAKSARMNEFLVELIGVAQPTQTKGKDVTIREALDIASAKVAETFKDDPEIEGSLRFIIGGTYSDLSVYDAAQEHLEIAVKLLRDKLGADHIDTLNALNRLALVYKDQGRLDLMEPLTLELLAARRRTLGEEHPDTIQSMNNTAMLFLLQGKPAKAEPLMRRTVEIRRSVLGPDHRSTIVSIDNLGRIVHNQGKLAEAEGLYRQALAAFTRTEGGDDPDTLSAKHNLAGVLVAQRSARRSDRRISQPHRAKTTRSWAQAHVHGLVDGGAGSGSHGCRAAFRSRALMPRNHRNRSGQLSTRPSVPRIIPRGSRAELISPWPARRGGERTHRLPRGSHQSGRPDSQPWKGTC
jgi:serine/threonine protein kinase